VTHVRRVAWLITLNACASSSTKDAGFTEHSVPYDVGVVVDVGTVAACPRLDRTTAVGSASVEAFCSGVGPIGAVGCPVEPPTPGASCSISPGRCAYRVSDTSFVAIVCDGARWQDDGSHECAGACQLPPTMTKLPVDVACGARAAIPCESWGELTHQDQINQKLGVAAACCGLPSANRLTVKLTNGCAVAYALERDDARVAECIGRLLAGRKLLCAEADTCAHFSAP
jgi:hypothetical protein